MKKTLLSTAMALAMGTGVAQAETFDFLGTFSMYSGAEFVGGCNTPDCVTGTFDFNLTTGTGSGGSMTSEVPFFGFNWTAHDFVMTATGPGTVSAQIPFDWGAPSDTTPCGVANCDIPVVAVFSLTPTGTPGEFSVATLDGDDSGTPGTAMTEGPFVGFSPTFSGTASVVPIPSADWLFGTGLLGLVGVARRKKSA